MKNKYALVLAAVLSMLLSVILMSCVVSPFKSRSFDKVTTSLEYFSRENFQDDLTGLTLHYRKTNLDDSMPSEVFVHYSSNSRSESFKIYPWSKKKQEVYLIIADYDAVKFQVSAISGNYVHSGGELEEYAALKCDSNEIRYTINGKEYPALVPGHTPAYIFNFDLTDFNTMIRYLDPETDVLDIGIIGLGRAGFVYSGKVRVVRDHENSTDESIVFNMGGEAFNGQSGTMTVDRNKGYVTGIILPMPTTLPYESFKFVLADVSYMSESAWNTFVAQKAEGILKQ